nr:hypothetical transcript [Hymenolepis microstoma]
MEKEKRAQYNEERPHEMGPSGEKYLETLKWEILPHTPYSPDVTPSDFAHLFRSMTYGLADQLSARMKK